MNPSSINFKQSVRNLIPWLFCIIFLISSGGFVASLDGSKASAPETEKGKESPTVQQEEPGCTDANFTEPVTSPEGAGNNPQSVAVGDFNLDGRSDLAVANRISNDVTILIGDATGNFTQPATSPEVAGTEPRSVAVGDFNRDGRPDLATANFGSNGVTILLGDGTGNFTQAATSPEATGFTPRSVTVGDFNLDGRPDLATANSNGNNVTILLGDGTGNFNQPATSPEVVNAFPVSLAAGDFNLDGRPDLAVVNNGSDNVTILIGDATGNFTQAATSSIAVGDLPQSVAIGDFNLDGKSDLAVANFGPDENLTILLGDGAGNFTEPASSPEGAGVDPFSVAVGDFNLDGRPDLAVAKQGSNVTILIGDATGNFTETATSPESTGTNPQSVAVGDFNLDGRSDLAVANRIGSSVTILLNTCAVRPCLTNYTWVTRPPRRVGFIPQSLAAGDFNLDGRTDLVTPNEVSDDVTILLGDGTGNFIEPATSPERVISEAQSVTVSDFNLDGKPDLAVADEGTGSSIGGSVYILLGDGTGDFTNPSSIAPELTGRSTRSVAVGDFNLDGKPDLAAANRDSDDVTILIGDGTGDFTRPATSPESAGADPEAVTVGDFNLDGKPDLAVANEQSGNVTILIGDGTGNFAQAATSPEGVGSFPQWVTVGDFNLDGKPDLATPNFFSNNVTILLGDGTGNFTQAATSPEATSINPTSVTVGDLNLDGKPDLAVTNEDTNSVTILIGDGTGNFTATPNSPEEVGASPQASIIDDFNFDGRPDIAVVNRGHGTVVVLIGICTTRPTITALEISQVVGTTSINKLIATVSDPDQPLQTLSITTTIDGVNYIGMGTSNGVTISNFAVDSAGNVTANVTATCTAAEAVFILKVTDAVGAHEVDILRVRVTPDTAPPTITCPPNQTRSNDPNQCGAVVNYPNATATDNCSAVGTPSCSPASGTFFPVGTTTVTCTVSDSRGNANSCTFTVTVNGAEGSGLTCPADKVVIAGNACPVATSAVVNYTVPVGTDNCTQVTAACMPPPGASFPVGTTTVTCKTTNSQGDTTSSCTFKVTVFNICLQDDANPNAKLMINSFTGQYRFQCGSMIFAGVGKITNSPGSCQFALNHTPLDRRVRANWATSTMSGNASIQAPVGVVRCTILDREMTDNNCNAP
ncbi:MAG TPA: FG-GAP-like repeat-containing protein [Blastocatellia bacterium]|nr:FG-GAP-like repeat-containing protein [Blastocatellia bacterium]